jgi:hypothetical protein
MIDHPKDVIKAFRAAFPQAEFKVTLPTGVMIASQGWREPEPTQEFIPFVPTEIIVALKKRK